jgi:hypothetical protein
MDIHVGYAVHRLPSAIYIQYKYMTYILNTFYIKSVKSFVFIFYSFRVLHNYLSRHDNIWSHIFVAIYWGVGKEGPFFIFNLYFQKSKKSEN